MVWSTVQLGIAITDACLPTLGPILFTISKQLSQVRSWGSTIWSRFRTGVYSGKNGYKVSQDNYEIPSNISQQPAKHATLSHGYSRSWAESQGQVHSGQGHFDQDVERFPSDVVLVERDVRVVY